MHRFSAVSHARTVSCVLVILMHAISTHVSPPLLFHCPARLSSLPAGLIPYHWRCGQSNPAHVYALMKRLWSTAHNARFLEAFTFPLNVHLTFIGSDYSTRNLCMVCLFVSNYRQMPITITFVLNRIVNLVMVLVSCKIIYSVGRLYRSRQDRNAIALLFCNGRNLWDRWNQGFCYRPV